jgi:hypothetical protein
VVEFAVPDQAEAGWQRAPGDAGRAVDQFADSVSMAKAVHQSFGLATAAASARPDGSVPHPSRIPSRAPLNLGQFGQDLRPVLNLSISASSGFDQIGDGAGFCLQAVGAFRQFQFIPTFSSLRCKTSSSSWSRSSRAL